MIPSFIKDVYKAHSKWGLLNWEELFGPSIKLAREGIIVYPYLIKMGLSDVKRLGYTSACADIYTKNGRSYEVGDLLIQKDYAKTLEIVSVDGPDVFYTGEISEKIVEDFEEHGTGYQGDAGTVPTASDLQGVAGTRDAGHSRGRHPLHRVSQGLEDRSGSPAVHVQLRLEPVRLQRGASSHPGIRHCWRDDGCGAPAGVRSAPCTGSTLQSWLAVPELSLPGAVLVTPDGKRAGSGGHAGQPDLDARNAPIPFGVRSRSDQYADIGRYGDGKNNAPQRLVAIYSR